MNRFRTKRNYFCHMFEGVFNALGFDLLGIDSIIPLFLIYCGVGNVVIGVIPTIRSVIMAIVPFLFGNIISGISPKKPFYIAMCAIFRPLILIIPVALIIAPGAAWIVPLLIVVLALIYINQSATSLTWNRMLAENVDPVDRGSLLSLMISISGGMAIFSSSLVKFIRENPGMEEHHKFAIIFTLAGIAFIISIFCFLPLKEKVSKAVHADNIRTYFAYLLKTLKNRRFLHISITENIKNISTMCNAFLYVYASSRLGLSVSQISNMLIIQTVGVVSGGFIFAPFYKRLGSKNILIMAESIGLLVPIISLLCGFPGIPSSFIYAAVFISGFRRSADSTGYGNYLIDSVSKDSLIHSIVIKNLIAIPVSFVSTLAGLVIDASGYIPVFCLQLAATTTALILCLTLKEVHLN